MDEEGEEQQQQQHGGVDQAFSPEAKPSAIEKMAPLPSPSFDIWPPSQRTRDAVIGRMVETLSTPSALSKRYGTLTHDEAADSARLIEEAAFSAAPLDQILADTIDGQIEILQIYSKEISKRMIESVKAKSTAAAAASPSPVISDITAEEKSPLPAPSAPATVEDHPTAETETPAS